jgi:hypothetical protein
VQRIAETMATIKEENADELKYNISGIGGDETCCLQVVADGACKNAEEIKLLADENVFNAVKVRQFDVGFLVDACLRVCVSI